MAETESEEGDPPKRGRGRPKVAEPRTEVLRIRLTEAEREALKRLAEQVGERPSVLARRILREASQPGSVTLFDEDGRAVRNASMELARVGRNLNQIAKAVNRGTAVLDPDVREDLEDTLREVRHVRDRVAEIVQRSRIRTKAFLRPVAGMKGADQ